VPVPVDHRQHVRVNGGYSVLATKESKRKTDHIVLIESADEDIPGCPASDGKCKRQGIFIRHTPYLLFNRLQLLEFFNRIEAADFDLLRTSARHYAQTSKSFELLFPDIISLRVEQTQPSTVHARVNSNQRHSVQPDPLGHSERRRHLQSRSSSTRL